MSETEVSAQNEAVFSTKVIIDNQTFNITPLTAKKTVFIANLLGKLLINGKLKLKQFKGLEGGDLPVAVLAALDEESLIELASVLIGSDKEFAEKNFNLAWVMEALVIQTKVSDLDAIIKNFTQLFSQLA